MDKRFHVGLKWTSNICTQDKVKQKNVGLLLNLIYKKLCFNNLKKLLTENPLYVIVVKQRKRAFFLCLKRSSKARQ